MINPHMIELAMKLRGMTQIELAQKLSLSQPQISHLINGMAECDINDLCACFDLPSTFFHMEPYTKVVLTDLNHGKTEKIDYLKYPCYWKLKHAKRVNNI